MWRRLGFGLLVVGSMLVIAACSSGSGAASGGLDGGALVPESDGGAAADASRGDTEGPWPPAPDLSGFSTSALRTFEIGVGFWEGVGGLPPQFIHGYRFTITEPAPPLPKPQCTETKSGSCTAFTACVPPPPGPTPTPPKSIDVQPTSVVFSGGGGADVDLGHRTNAATAADRWKPGDVVKAVVVGNPAVGIGDFEAKATVGGNGSVLVGTRTTLTGGYVFYYLHRQSAIPVTWDPGDGGIAVTVKQTSPSAVTIECTFDSAAGSGQIPADLALLLATDDPSSGKASTVVTRSRSGTPVPIVAGSFTGAMKIQSAPAVTETSVRVLDAP